MAQSKERRENLGLPEAGDDKVRDEIVPSLKKLAKLKEDGEDVKLKEEAIDDTKHVEIPRMFLVKYEGQRESKLASQPRNGGPPTPEKMKRLSPPSLFLTPPLTFRQLNGVKLRLERVGEGIWDLVGSSKFSFAC